MLVSVVSGAFYLDLLVLLLLAKLHSLERHLLALILIGRGEIDEMVLYRAELLTTSLVRSGIRFFDRLDVLGAFDLPMGEIAV